MAGILSDPIHFVLAFPDFINPLTAIGAMRIDLKKKFIKNQPFAIIAYK